MKSREYIPKHGAIGGRKQTRKNANKNYNYQQLLEDLPKNGMLKLKRPTFIASADRSRTFKYFIALPPFWLPSAFVLPARYPSANAIFIRCFWNGM